MLCLTLCTVTSVSMFSILYILPLFSTRFPWYWQEFISKSKLLNLRIISFLLLILMNDSAVLLQGGMSCWYFSWGKLVILNFALLTDFPLLLQEIPRVPQKSCGAFLCQVGNEVWDRNQWQWSVIDLSNRWMFTRLSHYFWSHYLELLLFYI